MITTNTRRSNELEALFRDDAQEVRSFIRRRCRCADIADDVASETFLAAAVALERQPDLVIGLPWLVTVAKRRLVDHWRSLERRNRLDHKLDLALVPMGEEGHSFEGNGIDEALEVLPERQRNALLLRYVSGYSVTEVAEVLDSEYVATESLLARARRGFAAAYSAAA